MSEEKKTEKKEPEVVADPVEVAPAPEKKRRLREPMPPVVWSTKNGKLPRVEDQVAED